ncbi:hypothetical protein PC9H_003686 [Pleurotus ostreatus]|uniref:Polysaccharide lyase family 8 protein n=2 Tax=Pleurotus TaxID=5320 RepID=A0A8H7DWP2_PLEOS|nr:uncharacterized protein PC9H_003686 [Pleurotus ostreatus]KAF7436853.1 hypothetical protein PC9H_003686 [Pleurotus ostreatus]KAG9222844.1 hypothetical protein CCMSSC00406_0000467 [Pleurotus cornucopiae]
MKGSLALASTFFIHSLFLQLSAALDAPHGASHFSRRKHFGRSINPQAQSSALSTVGATDVSSIAASSTSAISMSSTASASSISSVSVRSSVQASSTSITVSASALSSSSIQATSTQASTAASPSTSVPAQTAAEIKTITQRRLSTIVGGLSTDRAASISSWISTLGPDGKWPASEVDYTTACAARRANWPAQEHWQRIVVMAGAFHGGLDGTSQFVKNDTFRAVISRAMDFWFSNDFTNDACIDSGGSSSCPCDTPGLWNTNWFSNTILIPELSSATCLLLNNTLTSTQLSNCTHITLRAYGTFTRNPTFLAGANTLDVAKVGIDQALLTSNVSLMTDAYSRVHRELVIQNAIKADGIRADGSFGQHAGILYNGNYGKDYTNDLLNIEVEAAGTEFAANNASQSALSTLFDGDLWMTYRNVLSGRNFWDFAALGRFISFPVIDGQASAGLGMNLSRVHELGEEWGADALINFANTLSQNSSNSANGAKLNGNRMFYANDYMVHRGQNYVTSVKMYSKRTVNTECTNTQNPLGFHLSDGVVHTYLQGNEYEDISAAWDWNLIPGITVDYGATALSCDRTGFTGIEAFVGGASTGRIGVAAMRYSNPFTKAFHFQKAWFFFENDIQHVMVSNISSTTTAPVFSVLDQRLHVGEVSIDSVSLRETGNITRAGAETLWHGGVGYVFPRSNANTPLHIQVGNKKGNWSAIGTSTQPPPTVDLFAASLEHKDIRQAISYTVLPGIDKDTFHIKSKTIQLRSVQNDGHISAVYDPVSDVVMSVFWDTTGGSTSFTSNSKTAPITVKSSGNVALVFNHRTGDVTVSDPSQSLQQVTIQINTGSSTSNLVFTLPSGGLAGNSVTKKI